MFAAKAFEPLQVLTMPEQDLQIVRHASRTLAELARVCLPVSIDPDPDPDAPDGVSAVTGSASESQPSHARTKGGSSRSLMPRLSGTNSGRSLSGLLSSSPVASGAEPMLEATGSWTSGLGSAAGSWASGSWAFGWPSIGGEQHTGVASFERPLSHANLQSLCRGPASAVAEAMLPRIIRADSGVQGVEWLDVLAVRNDDWLVQRHAALAYSRIAMAAHGWLAINAADDTVPALLHLAIAEDPLTRKHAKSALAALSKHKAVHAAIVNDRRLKTILTHPRNLAASAASGDPLTETRLASLILRHLTNTVDGRRRLMDGADATSNPVRRISLSLIMHW